MPGRAVEAAAGLLDGAEDKRARILLAAHDVCLDRGFEAARMDEIASLARVSKGTLYRYFASKEELLMASVIETHARGEALIDSYLPDASDPREELEGVLAALVEGFVTLSQAMTVTLQAAAFIARDASTLERLEVALRDIYASRMQRFRAVIGEGQRVGQFRGDIDVSSFASSLLALYDGFLFRSTFESAARVREDLELAYRGMLAHACRTSPDQTAGAPAHA